MPNDIITEREKLLDPTYVLFLKGDFSTEVANIFGAKLNFSPDLLRVLENAIDLFLYCFFDEAQLADFISTECELDPTEAKLLAKAILLSLPEGLTLAQATTYQILNSAQNQSETPVQAQGTPNLQSEIAEAEAALRSIPTMRTMTDDMRVASATRGDENIYSSSQEAILGGARLRAAPDSSPKWGSQD